MLFQGSFLKVYQFFSICRVVGSYCLLYTLSGALFRKKGQPPNITKNITFKEKETLFLIIGIFKRENSFFIIL